MGKRYYRLPTRLLINRYGVGTNDVPTLPNSFIARSAFRDEAISFFFIDRKRRDCFVAEFILERSEGLLSRKPDLQTKFAGATLPPLEKGDSGGFPALAIADTVTITAAKSLLASV